MRKNNNNGTNNEAVLSVSDCLVTLFPSF